jgi:MATE family multidrug resistance protein
MSSLNPFHFDTNKNTARPPPDNMSGQPPTEGSSSRAFGTSFRSQLGSFLSSSPIAEQAIAIDAEDDDEEPSPDSSEDESDTSTLKPTEYSMNHAYRRPSFVAAGPRSALIPGQLLPEKFHLSKKEKERMQEEERSLLRDNELLPPKHPRRQGSDDNIGAKFKRKMSLGGLRKVKSTPDEESGATFPGMDNGAPSETTGLLEGRNPSLPYGGEDTPKNLKKKWDEAIQAGKIQTSWQREAKVLTKYSRSLIVTFILQYSLTMASIFTVGHIGKVELGAVSLASSTLLSLYSYTCSITLIYSIQ